jgi:hypothetical protein
MHSVSELAEENSSKGNTSGTVTLSTCTKRASTSNASTCSSSNSNKKKRIEYTSGSISSFVVRTRQKLKHDLDKQIAKAIYQTNSSFRCLEKSEVSKAIEMLRPGYVPPTPYAIGNPLLQEIYEEEKHECFKNLSNACVCMSIDGWSNIHNEPVVCATVTTEKGEVYLYETIDTSGHPHTAEYLSEIVGNLITSCAHEYNCTVTSFVTDNAANMNKMREEIKNEDNSNIITYGCSAHMMNLLAHDLQVSEVKSHIVQIIKYFRNNHFANAKYKQEGCKALILPSDVRWNTMADCLEIYLKEWPKLVKICEENKDKIDSIIYGKIMNMVIKQAAEEYLKILKPVAVALDKLQKNLTFISDAVEIWKELEDKLTEAEVNLSKMQLFEKRYERAMTPAHFLAFIIDPREKKYNLTSEETSSALEFANAMYGGTGFLPLIIKFQNKSAPFRSLMFSQEMTSNISPVEWWISHKDLFGNNKDEVVKIAKQLLGAVASSASVERIFSSFGLIHSKLRNRLGTEKAGKLVFLFKHYNNKCNILFDE